MTFVPELEVPAAAVRVLVSFRPGVTLEQEDRALVVAHPWGRYRLRGLEAHEEAVLAGLATGDVDASVLAAVRGALVDRLVPLVARTVAVGERRLATAVPMTGDAVLQPLRPAEAEATVRLASFAYLRRPDGEPDAVLESPLARHRVLLHDGAAAALVGSLAAAPVVEHAARAVSGLTLEAALELVDLLVAAGLAELDGVPADPALELWDFHDLVFHARSRLGRHDHPFGGLYRHAGTHPALPARAPALRGPAIELPRPEWTDVVGRDATLTEVLESRRSIRDYREDPITVAQVGELLYRAARVRGVIAADPEGGLPYDALDRPFPTGGGSGELELYLTVARCEGLDAGVYHYDAAAHRLRKLDASDEDRRELLTAAWRAAAGRVDPQVLITVTSRFGRLSWKYSSIAYALTLKHVGVLYQTLYLVATAMGLAPCALGSGNADVAARAFGLEWASESSVGEFLVGSRAADSSGSATAFVDVVDTSRA